jgi:hypothetical protein
LKKKLEIFIARWVFLPTVKNFSFFRRFFWRGGAAAAMVFKF